jgi:hypothetical protein
MKFYFEGQKVNGSNLWYSDTGARWFHTSSFTRSSSGALEGFVFPEPVVPEPVVPEPVVPEPVVPEPVVPEPVVPEPVVPEPVVPAPNWGWWAGLVSLIVSLLAAIRSKPKP